MDGTNIVQTAYISTNYQCTNIVQQPIFVIFIVYILSEPLKFPPKYCPNLVYIPPNIVQIWSIKPPNIATQTL